MRATLLTAQKMASQMVQEAEKEKADLLAAAESEMGARKAALEAEIAAESERLRLAKEESAAFIANMRRLCSSEFPRPRPCRTPAWMSRCTPLNPPSCLLSPNRRRRLKRRPKPNRNRQRSLPGTPLHRKKRTLPIRMPPRIWRPPAASISAT